MREADHGSGERFRGSVNGDGPVTDLLPTQRTFLELTDPLTVGAGRGRRRAAPGQPWRSPWRGGVGAPRYFARAFIAKVAGNPFSRARDKTMSKDLRAIQVEKFVNARSTLSWS